MQDAVFIIYEKSALIRLGIISLLRETEHARIAADFRGMDDFKKNIESIKPDFVILSSRFIPEMDVEAFKNAQKEHEFKTILLFHEDFQKKQSFWIEEIYTTEEKILIIDKLERLINKFLSGKKTGKDNNEISKRERAVLAMVAQGYTNKEIAEKLFISTHTVITHRKNIVRKLGIKTVSGLTVYAILNKIIDMQDLK